MLSHSTCEYNDPFTVISVIYPLHDAQPKKKSVFLNSFVCFLFFLFFFAESGLELTQFELASLFV
jgi:hypothetical protein